MLSVAFFQAPWKRMVRVLTPKWVMKVGKVFLQECQRRACISCRPRGTSGFFSSKSLRKALLTIRMSSSILGGTKRKPPRPSWAHPTNLWVFQVGPCDSKSNSTHLKSHRSLAALTPSQAAAQGLGPLLVRLAFARKPRTALPPTTRHHSSLDISGRCDGWRLGYILSTFP